MNTKKNQRPVFDQRIPSAFKHVNLGSFDIDFYNLRRVSEPFAIDVEARLRNYATSKSAVIAVVYHSIHAGSFFRLKEGNRLIFAISDQHALDPHTLRKTVHDGMALEKSSIGICRLKRNYQAAGRQYARNRQRDQADMRSDVEGAAPAPAGLDAGRKAGIVSLAPAGKVAERELTIKPKRPVAADRMARRCIPAGRLGKTSEQATKRQPQRIEALQWTVT